jgi:hypothetical protein
VDITGADAWIRDHVAVDGAPVVVHERPWSTVMRVPLRDGSSAWFKACALVQAFEPALTSALARRWPEVMPDLIAGDVERGWLLLGDAGTRIFELDNPPAVWLRLLPLYAELQRGEAEHSAGYIESGVPELTLNVLPEEYDNFVRSELPIDSRARRELRAFAPTLTELCQELTLAGIPSSVQHDDLHPWNVYVQGDLLRILDWGDSSIAHPFWSLVVPFRFLEEQNGLTPDDPWFDRLRDAYLEPWGPGLGEAMDLALRVGIFAHAVAWLRQRDHLEPEERQNFDAGYTVILHRALLRITA